MRDENQLFPTDPARDLAPGPLLCFGASGTAARIAASDRIDGDTPGARQAFPCVVGFEPQGHPDLAMTGAAA